MRSFPGLVLIPLLLAAACDRPGAVNPPTEPARPVEGAAASAPPPQSPAGMGALMRGAGARNFVGRWAAQAEWCANPRGDNVPIEITTTELRGYENLCRIETIVESGEGYDAQLLCDGEGVQQRERVRFVATAESLRLTWLDRDAAAPVQLIRCTALSG